MTLTDKNRETVAATDKNQVAVELYELSISQRKEDRFGRVVSGKSLNEDDLIKIAVQRRTDISPSSFRAVMDILKDIAIEEICNGSSVSFGLGHFGLSVNGVFTGDHAAWDSTRHSLSARIIPNGALRGSVAQINVKVLGMATTGTIINSVTDIASSKVNEILTPGGGINIAGSKIRVEGDKPEVGIKLINQTDSKEVIIPKTAILLNNPSVVMVVVPADLPKGDYKLAITTQFAGSKILLKEARTAVFDYVLTV